MSDSGVFELGVSVKLQPPPQSLREEIQRRWGPDWVTELRQKLQTLEGDANQSNVELEKKQGEVDTLRARVTQLETELEEVKNTLQRAVNKCEEDLS